MSGLTVSGMIAASELRLGDVIVTTPGGHDDGFLDATVIHIRSGINGGHGWATVFRPYVSTSDFKYAGASGGQQVIPYIGVEQYDVPMNEAKVLLKRRNKIEFR